MWPSLPWGHATTWGSPWLNCTEVSYYIIGSLYSDTTYSVILISFCRATKSAAVTRCSTQSFYKLHRETTCKARAHARFRTGDAIRSKSETLNPKALHLKEEGQINNNVIQAIHYGIIEEKVIVFICGDLFVGQIYESSSTELNMGERAEFC